jgi:hypothetical protein
MKDYAVKKLLRVKNEDWREDGEIKVIKEELKNTMKLQYISVEPDGDLYFGYDDGGLFDGHEISVYGNLSKGPTGCDF